MEIQGKITQLFDVLKGESKNGEWTKTNLLVETPEQYNNKYFFEVFGDDLVNRLQKFNIGDEIIVSFNIKTNEYQDRFYTSLSAWKITVSNLVPDSI